MVWIWLIIALIIIGIVFLILEFLVLPGITVAGIVGSVLIIYANWKAFALYGNTTGTFVILGTFLLFGILLFLAVKFGNWKKVALKTSIDGKVNETVLDNINVNDTGITVSRLAPSGNILINNKLLEVHTFGEFIDQDKEVIVIEISDNKIYVTSKK